MTPTILHSWLVEIHVLYRGICDCHLCLCNSVEAQIQQGRRRARGVVSV